MANPLAASTPQMPATSLVGLPHAPGCCEVGQPIYSDPRTGQPICSCQLTSGMIPGAPRVPGAGDLPYPIPPTLQGPGAAFPGGEPPAFYAPMGGAYGLKEGPEVFQGISPLNGYYPYDPTMIYPYMNGFGGLDARRKNATKESTNTLKAWLYEHRKNPYPTKGEKIMLAILTKMTLTQVSTWFANARRRLKKENKVGWSSKDDEDGDDDKDDDKTGSDDEDIGRAHNDRSMDDGASDVSGSLEQISVDQKDEDDIDVDGDDDIDVTCAPPLPLRPHTQSSPSGTAVVPITPPPSPGAQSSNSVSKENHVANRPAPSSSAPHTAPLPTSREGSNRTQAPVNGQPKQNTNSGSGSSAPKPKIWSVDDMVGTKKESSPSSTISPPAVRPVPSSVAHAPFMPPQFYPGFNGLSSAESGMSLALAYSRGLAAVGSAGLQTYPPMAAHFHPGMEGAHLGSLPPTIGVRPMDPHKPPISHHSISSRVSPIRRDRSPVDERQHREPGRPHEERSTAFRPIPLRR